jgi:hypothetical protein
MFVVRDNEQEGHSSMKFKILVIILALALASFAQTTSQATTPAQDSKTCACCSHDKASGDSKSDCCKDGKCPMMSGNHAAMKCPMMAKDGKMADGKMCCASNKCPTHAKAVKGSGCCCGNMDEQKPAGM